MYESDAATQNAEVERPYVPTVDDIKARWASLNVNAVPMVSTESVKMDLLVVFAELDELRAVVLRQLIK